MKKIFLLLGLAGLLGTTKASAQYFYTPFVNAGQNPGGLNTDYEEPNQPGWNRILFGLNSQTTAPVWTLGQAVPFAFQFNGQPAAYYKVSSSGVLTFDTLAANVPPPANVALPSALVPDKSVCVWGLGARSGGNIVTRTFGTAPNRQYWVQFNNFAEAGNFNVVRTYWAIVLEETSNKIYVVDQRTDYSASAPLLTLTVGVQINASTAEQLPASPNVNTHTPLFNADDEAVDNTYYTFNPGVRPAQDLALRTLALPAILSRQNPIIISGQLENLGSQAASSYTLGYRVDNGPAVTGAITGVNVPSLTTAAYTHPTPWQPASGGVYRLKVWVASPNGQPDGDHSNDTVRAVVQVGDSTMRRLVVEECFTSSTCGPCVLGNQTVESVNRANRNKQVVIKYQQNFPSPGNDPYYTAESGARRGYYGINAIPYMTLDGGWNQNSQSFTTGILSQYQARPALARVRGTYTISPNGRVNAQAIVRPLLPLAAGQWVVQTVITERHTVNNRRTNGETNFFQVMKKMLPNQNGTPLPALTSGQDFPLNLSFDTSLLPTTQGVEHLDSLRVVVFVQNPTTKEIYQGAYLTLTSRPTATRAGSAGPAFVLAPNPGTGRSTLYLTLDRPETVRVDVLDLAGRRVQSQTAALGNGSQQVDLDLTGRAAGLYTVRLTTSQGVQAAKLGVE